MSVDIHYFDDLEQESFALWNQCEQMNIFDLFDSMVPDKILYEKHPPVRAKVHPQMGRYDRFLCMVAMKNIVPQNLVR